MPNYDNVSVDPKTGDMLTGWQAVQADIIELLVTKIGQRVTRENVGSLLPHMLGKQMTPQRIMLLKTSIASAIELHEPRYDVTSVEVPQAASSGKIRFVVTGLYKPRIQYGDDTAISQSFEIGL